MLADEGAVLDSPQALPDAKTRKEFLFGAGQTESVGGDAELVGLLPVDDPGIGVCQQAVGEGTHGGALVANIFQIGEFVEDEHVRDAVMSGESPVRVHAAQQSGMGHEPPGLVVDAPALPTGRVEQRGFHPRR